MPAKSQSQRRLMGAAVHGATFPKARAIRRSMSKGQMREFASTQEKGLPRYVKKQK